MSLLGSVLGSIFKPQMPGFAPPGGGNMTAKPAATEAQPDLRQAGVNLSVAQPSSRVEATTETPPAAPVTVATPAAAPVVTIATPTSSANITTTTFNAQILEAVASTMARELLHPTNQDADKAKMLQLITDSLAGTEIAVPEFKQDLVVARIGDKAPSLSFNERVINEYANHVADRETYSGLKGADLEAAIHSNLKPLLELAVQGNTHAANRLLERSFLLHGDIGSKGFNHALSSARNVLTVDLAEKNPALFIKTMDQSNSPFIVRNLVETMQNLGKEQLTRVLNALKQEPEKLLASLEKLTASEDAVRALSNYGDINKGTHHALGAILDTVKALSTANTKAQTAIVGVLTDIVHHPAITQGNTALPTAAANDENHALAA